MTTETPATAAPSSEEDPRVEQLDPLRLRLLEQLRAQRRPQPPPGSAEPPRAEPPRAEAPRAEPHHTETRREDPPRAEPPPPNPWGGNPFGAIPPGANPFGANPFQAWFSSMSSSPMMGAFAGPNGTAWGSSAAPPPPSPGPAGAEQPLVQLRPDGDKAPLYIVHAIYGSVFPYHQLARRLEPGRPVIGIKARGLDDGQDPRLDIAEMAEAYSKALASFHPGGPVHLVGYSFGAWVAYAMAERLSREGLSIGLCAPMGVAAPTAALAPELGTQVETMVSAMADYVKLMRNMAMAEGREDPLAWLHQLPQSQRLLMAHNIAAMRFRPVASSLPLHLVVTTEQHGMVDMEPTLGWKSISSADIAAHKLSGNHLSMFDEPQVAELATLLDGLLAGHDAA